MGLGRVTLWGSLLLVVGTQLPIFLQMTLTPDAVLYDVQARSLLDGGVLYRDVVEPNLPGIVWVHAIVRTLAGWSTLMLRVFDLAVVMGIALLLSRFVSGPLVERPLKHLASGFFVAGLLLFYFSTSEWCHCQRDTWMLLPCLLAVLVRWHVMVLLDGKPQELIHDGGGVFGWTVNKVVTVKSIVAWGFVEGVLWGLGFWLKPFVAIPAVAVMVGALLRDRWRKCCENGLAYFPATDAATTPSSGLTASGGNSTCRRREDSSPCEGEKGHVGAVEWILIQPAQRGIGMIQACAVIAGGAVVGVLGVAWMIGSGCWPHFVRMLTEWNGDYFSSGRSGWTLERYSDHVGRFWPWILLHGPALWITLNPLLRRLRGADIRPAGSTLIAVILLRSLYLGWIIQAFTLQQLFDYVHVPGLMLAMAVCAQAVCEKAVCEKAVCEKVGTATVGNIRPDGTRPENFNLPWSSLIVPMAVAFVAWCAVSSPAFRRDRQQHWLACVQACWGAPLEPQIRDDLALVPFPRWTELQPMLDMIRQMEIPDGSTMAYNGNLIHLYPELSMHPPTRFVYVDALARCFPRRRSEIVADLDHSGVRYVVSDLFEDGWEGDLSGTWVLPDAVSDETASMFFPYNQTPIWRSGRYVLFEVRVPIRDLTSERCPLSKPGAWRTGRGGASDD